jgi:hypothetical protein
MSASRGGACEGYEPLTPALLPLSTGGEGEKGGWRVARVCKTRTRKASHVDWVRPHLRVGLV